MAPTILVVEDEPHTQHFLTVVLEDAGYTVQTAGDGMQALHRVEQRRPDLILSDIMMPVMDGMRLCQVIQANPSYRAIPIILMSAFVQPQAIEHCAPAAYLPKPFLVEDLLTLIRRVLGVVAVHEEPA